MDYELNLPIGKIKFNNKDLRNIVKKGLDIINNLRYKHSLNKINIYKVALQIEQTTAIVETGVIRTSINNLNNILRKDNLDNLEFIRNVMSFKRLSLIDIFPNIENFQQLSGFEDLDFNDFDIIIII